MRQSAVPNEVSSPPDAAPPRLMSPGEDSAWRPASERRPATPTEPVPEQRASDPATLEPKVEPSPSGSARTNSAQPARFYALDALRGLSIGLMVFVNWAGNWSLPEQLRHAEYSGLTIADTVFPAFLVAMGTAIPYATRTGWRRAFGRAIMLILIGSALVSYHYGQPYDLTVGVLQLIGVTYLLAWLVTRLPRLVQLPLVAAVLIGVTAAYLGYEVPGIGAGSFEREANLGDWVDSLLGFAPHPENPHAILSAFGTVFIGVLAGRISRDFKGWGRLGMLTVLGAGTLGLGLALAGVVPITKYLWTPSFALVTGGIAVLALVVLALLIPRRSKGGPLRPLVVLGGHAIVVYAFSETVVARAHGEWLWPHWEPIVTERWGELAAGVAFPAGAVLACLVLAWAMELLRIRVRL